MDELQLKQLKDQYGKFLTLYSEHNRANQKEKKRIEGEIETLQNRMIQNHELNLIDPYIYNSVRKGNYWFKIDMDKIIDQLSVAPTEKNN